MMNYNFDEIINRKNTNSIKYDFAAQRGKQADLLPLWVADMDFKTAPEIINALKKSVEHGIFGYSDTKQAYFDSIYNWYSNRFNWHVEKSWLVKTPGIVYAIATAIRGLTNKNDSVIIQRPVYYPFTGTVISNERKLINNPLVYKNGSYRIDFDDFESKIIDNKVKLFILCSPHNPVGRVWTKDELIRLGDICLKHNVIVLSDEIHSDFTYNKKHYIFSSLKPEFQNNSIICTAPSKTFNLAGLQVSNIFIANKDIRKKFIEEINRSGYSQLNTMGLVACQAAYDYGSNWLDELKKYLQKNLNFVRDFISEHLPQIKLVEPEGTYLVWLDFKSLNLNSKELDDLIENKAKLWLDNGVIFGPEGEGFMRINIACPRATLEKAFLQLRNSL